MRANNRAAFTLVELAIVLVVIGLVIGGVMGGQSLLRTSQVRSLMTDLTNYASATQQFRTEFRALPGDMPNATQYWGFAAGTTGIDATCYNANESNGVATCNGNGNGDIDTTNSYTSVNDATEAYLAWKHLSNAGLITGVYSGQTANSGAFGTVGGTNSPAGKISGSTYILRGGIGCQSGSTTYYNGCYGIIMEFGGPTASFTPSTMLGTDEMYSIDKKLDDGLPGYGMLRAYGSAVTPNCSTDANTYTLSSSGTNCSGLFAVDPITPN